MREELETLREDVLTFGKISVGLVGDSDETFDFAGGQLAPGRLGTLCFFVLHLGAGSIRSEGRLCYVTNAEVLS